MAHWWCGRLRKTSAYFRTCALILPVGSVAIRMLNITSVPATTGSSMSKVTRSGGPPPCPLDEFVTRIENRNLFGLLPPFARSA